MPVADSSMANARNKVDCWGWQAVSAEWCGPTRSQWLNRLQAGERGRGWVLGPGQGARIRQVLGRQLRDSPCCVWPRCRFADCHGCHGGSAGARACGFERMPVCGGGGVVCLPRLDEQGMMDGCTERVVVVRRARRSMLICADGE